MSLSSPRPPPQLPSQRGSQLALNGLLNKGCCYVDVGAVMPDAGGVQTIRRETSLFSLILLGLDWDAGLEAAAAAAAAPVSRKRWLQQDSSGKYALVLQHSCVLHSVQDLITLAEGTLPEQFSLVSAHAISLPRTAPVPSVHIFCRAT